MCDSIFPDLTTYCCIVFVCLTIHALRLSVLLLTPSLACTLANIHSLEWCFFAIPVRCLLKSVRVIFLGGRTPCRKSLQVPHQVLPDAFKSGHSKFQQSSFCSPLSPTFGLYRLNCYQSRACNRSALTQAEGDEIVPLLVFPFLPNVTKGLLLLWGVKGI